MPVGVTERGWGALAPASALHMNAVGHDLSVTGSKSQRRRLALKGEPRSRACFSFPAHARKALLSGQIQARRSH